MGNAIASASVNSGDGPPFLILTVVFTKLSTKTKTNIIKLPIGIKPSLLLVKKFNKKGFYAFESRVFVIGLLRYYSKSSNIF